MIFLYKKDKRKKILLKTLSVIQSVVVINQHVEKLVVVARLEQMFFQLI